MSRRGFLKTTTASSAFKFFCKTFGSRLPR
ncbi:MAG: twin-arginine translocation signal domain-containing protein [Planctomycetes bacterium]|nr:twin-arginine translocation signal domain-containing protein [Planctomycetota bacterium]